MWAEPTGRCRFCGYLYYTWKLPAHEAVCSCRAWRYIGLPAPLLTPRELTEKERRLIAELEKGPKRFTDLLRCRVYGNRGLAKALADLHIEGLVDKDENQSYVLTKEGRKQALRERGRAPSMVCSMAAPVSRPRGGRTRCFSQRNDTARRRDSRSRNGRC